MGGNWEIRSAMHHKSETSAHLFSDDGQTMGPGAMGVDEVDPCQLGDALEAPSREEINVVRRCPGLKIYRLSGGPRLESGSRGSDHAMVGLPTGDVVRETLGQNGNLILSSAPTRFSRDLGDLKGTLVIGMGSWRQWSNRSPGVVPNWLTVRRSWHMVPAIS